MTGRCRLVLVLALLPLAWRLLPPVCALAGEGPLSLTAPGEGLLSLAAPGEGPPPFAAAGEGAPVSVMAGEGRFSLAAPSEGLPPFTAAGERPPVSALAGEGPLSLAAPGEGAPISVMAGEGPPSRTLAHAAPQAVDAGLRRHDEGGPTAALPPALPPPDRLAVLRRGVAITGWFRFPASADPAALRSYLPDSAIAALRHAGFSFVRLPVQPEFLQADPARLPLLVEAVRRLQRAGLGVVIDAHPATWQLETSASDRAALLAFWRAVAPALSGLDPRLTFPELLNEPVFANAAPAWAALQETLRQAVRAALPDATIVLTGNDWGSIAGLAALPPAADPDVIYSIHFYEPAELTALAAYRAGLDRAALARLPFPADPVACARLAAATGPATAGVIRFYCALDWNPARVAGRIATAAAWARRNHAAVLLGEFGATAQLAEPARLAWLRAVRTASEQAGIGWALWGYDDVMGFDLTRPAGRHPVLLPALLQALGLDTRS